MKRSKRPGHAAKAHRARMARAVERERKAAEQAEYHALVDTVIDSASRTNWRGRVVYGGYLKP